MITKLQTTCDMCGIEFEYQKGKKPKYCSDACRFASMVGKKNPKAGRKIKMVKRLCIGSLCRSEREFWSEGPHNRLCYRCQVQAKSNSGGVDA